MQMQVRHVFAVNNNRVDRKLPSVTSVGSKNELVMLESKLTLASTSKRISDNATHDYS